SCAERVGNELDTCYTHACLGWLADLVGNTTEAEQRFIAADKILFDSDEGNGHMSGLEGVQWADLLARTGRPGPAQALAERNAEICRTNRWNNNAAQYDGLLGRFAVAAGDITTAGARLAAAVGCFRDGDCHTELSVTLGDLARYAQVS